MTAAIERERLASTFTELCQISTPSRRERPLADHLVRCFTGLGADKIYFDQSGAQTGSDTGNLLIRFAGNAPEIDGLFFSCHMDTVEPGDNVQVVRIGDTFTSGGDTVLGGDDKSGIAALIELMTVLTDRERGMA